MRETLKAHYGDKPVGLGGTFLIESGKAKLHVMVSLKIPSSPLVSALKQFEKVKE